MHECTITRLWRPSSDHAENGCPQKKGGEENRSTQRKRNEGCGPAATRIKSDDSHFEDHVRDDRAS